MLLLFGSAIVHLVLMTITPAFSFDEVLYVARALRFAGSGSLYASTFWDHPFLGWAILGVSFKALGFPAIVIGGTPNVPLFPLLWSIPRGVMIGLATGGSYLVYRIALKLFHDCLRALISLALICFAPLSGYFRMVLLDNIANLFLLAALWLSLESQDRKRRHVFAALSGMAYGSALLTKLSFLAFFPACRGACGAAA
jgi:4-amino-4-deoxy-L-arabinose transferase-like glycosyltransferase